MKALFSACYSNSFDQMEVKVRGLLLEGYSITQLLLQFHDMLVTMDTITDIQKSVIAERMGVSLSTLFIVLDVQLYTLSSHGVYYRGWNGT